MAEKIHYEKKEFLTLRVSWPWPWVKPY